MKVVEYRIYLLLGRQAAYTHGFVDDSETIVNCYSELFRYIKKTNSDEATAPDYHDVNL